MTALGEDHGAVRLPRAPRRLLAGLLLPFVVAAVAGLVLLWPHEADALRSRSASDAVVRATVVRVEGSTPTVRLDEGPDAGDTVVLDGRADGDAQFDVGERVVIGHTADGTPFVFGDRGRRTPLLVLGALFALAVVAVGRVTGVRALVGLAVSLLVIVVFVLPAILEGSSPLAVSLTGAAVIAVVATYLAHGVSARSTVAVLGTLVSLGLVGALAYVFAEACRLGGVGEADGGFLATAFGTIDVRGLLLGGIVLGALGALADVTLRQVDAVDELRGAGPPFRPAMRAGRRHAASSVNTLVLAYAGASLPVLLLFTSGPHGLVDVATSEVVAVEVVRALVGGIGLLAAVPITTALAARLLGRRPPAPRPPRGDPRGYRNRKERDFWATAEALPTGRAEAADAAG
jgi:uncharacterized membrane protein